MTAPPSATTEAEPDANGEGGSGLTFPQIAAGALAAATASILGSFLGVLGTIGGAAAASIVSTVGAALYQRSLERTRDKVKERLVVNPTGSQVAAAVARVTGQGPAGAGTGRAVPGAPGPRPGAPGRAVPGAGVPGSGAPTRVVGPATARPGGPPPPGAPPRGPDGRPLPERQLRAGGRTVATQVHQQGAPTRVGGSPPRTPYGGIPTARMTGTPPGGNPATMRMGPPGPNGGWGPPGGDDAATQLTHVTQEATPRTRRVGKKTWFTLAGVAASVFVIGVLASFGVESATGHPLSGGSSGTSVGSLFGQQTGAATATSEPSSTDAPSDDATRTTTSSPDDDRSGSADSTRSNSNQDGSSPQTSQRRSSSNSDNGSGNGGGGLLPTQVLPRFGNDSSSNG